LFPLRPLGSTIVTRFIATTGRSDSLTGTLTNYFFSATVDLPFRPHRPARVSHVPEFTFWPRRPLWPRRVHRLLLNIAWALVLASPPLKGWPLSICLTRLDWVRLRYGSVIRSTGLWLTKLLPPATSFATCSMFNSHGKHLSFCEFIQSFH